MFKNVPRVKKKKKKKKKIGNKHLLNLNSLDII